MSEIIKVNPENFGKKDTLSLSKSKIDDYFIGDLVESKVKQINKDIDNKYKAGLFDFDGEEDLSSDDMKKLVKSLDEIVMKFNSKIEEAKNEYGNASSMYKTEILGILNQAGLDIENIKLGPSQRENGLGNIAYYAGGGGLDERMAKAGL